MRVTKGPGGFIEAEFDHVGKKSLINIKIRFGVSQVRIIFDGELRTVRPLEKPAETITIGELLDLHHEAIQLATLGGNEKGGTAF